QSVIILEAELDSSFIPKLDQLLQIRLNNLADALARFPYGLAPCGIGRFLEDLPNLAVGHLLAIDLGTEDVELLLNGVGLGDNLPEQFDIDLLLEIGQVENVNGAGEDRIIDLPGRILELLQFGEESRVRERLIDAVLRRLLAAEVFRLAGDI